MSGWVRGTQNTPGIDQSRGRRKEDNIGMVEFLLWLGLYTAVVISFTVFVTIQYMDYKYTARLDPPIFHKID
jgi:hypothetical protein